MSVKNIIYGSKNFRLSAIICTLLSSRNSVIQRSLEVAFYLFTYFIYLSSKCYFTIIRFDKLREHLNRQKSTMKQKNRRSLLISTSIDPLSCVVTACYLKPKNTTLLNRLAPSLSVNTYKLHWSEWNSRSPC